MPAYEAPPLDPGPVVRPAGWLGHVNAPQTEAEAEALRECIRRRRPYGDEVWAERAAKQLGLEASLRPRGRPRKSPTPQRSSATQTAGINSR
jgi:putative transposase